MPGNNNMNPLYAAFWELINLEFMMKFFAAYFVFVWIALILWVGKDISSRTGNALYRIISVLIVIIFSPLWIFLYLLIRPRRITRNAFTKEIEENLWILSEIVDERISHHHEISCPNCHELVEADYLMCPNCETTLKHHCKDCKKEIRETWSVCPFCEAKQ